MTFLNPLVLLGLAAASIPVILHLMRQRRPQRVDFSSLAFVETMQEKAVQRLRIKRWLLLALRMLVIICLVLAFAGPMVPAGWFGDVGERQPVSLGIVVDDAPGTAISDEEGNRLEQVQRATQQLLDETERGDQVFTARASNPTPIRHIGAGGASDRISELQSATSGRPLIQSARRMAAFLEEEAIHENQAVAVISPFTEAITRDSVRASWPQQIEPLLLPVGADGAENSAVTDAEVASAFAAVGRSVQIEGTFETFGVVDEVRSETANLFIEGDRVAQTSVQLQSGRPATASFNYTPEEEGWLAGSIELDAESAIPDVQRHFSLHIPAEQEILLVEGPASAPYVELALSVQLEEGSLFAVEQVDEAAFFGTDLAPYDAVVLSGLSEIPEAVRGDVARYIEAGGGVMIFPSGEAALDDHNALLNRLEGGQFTGLDGMIGADDPVKSITNFDLTHPVLAEIFEQPNGGDRIERPDVYATLDYESGGRVERSLISFADGTPFYQEVAYASGLAMLWSVAPQDAWSDLPRRGLFVPILHRSLHYLAAAAAPGRVQAYTGEPATFTLRGIQQEENLELVDGAGETHPLSYESLPGGLQVRLNPAPDDPGVYDLRADDELLQRVAVNLNPVHSNPALADRQWLADRFAELTGREAQLADDGDVTEVLRRTVHAEGGHTNLWSLFAILAVVFLVAESVVARRSS